MYGQDPDLIREVLNIFHLNWYKIHFVAHGTPIKDLGAGENGAMHGYEVPGKR
jgi:hypothetical protein